MKICVGLKNYESVEKYINAGADEFFCGVVDKSWVERYGYIIGINRRPWPSTNLKDFGELKHIADKAHRSNCKVYFTVNEHCYTDSQLEIIDYHIYKALECGADAIIFSDIGLIKYFYEKYKCNIHLSTGGTVFNKWSARFSKEELGVTRVIMPREVTIDEIRSITSGEPDLEYEVFILNEGCINIDGFCNHVHGLSYVNSQGELQNQHYSVGCMWRYSVTKVKLPEHVPSTPGELSKKLFHAVTRRGDCGLCALYFFKDMEVKSVKLVGRATNEDKIVNDIELLKNAIALSNEVGSFAEFYSAMSKLSCKSIAGTKSYYCYYPDILRFIENE